MKDEYKKNTKKVKLEQKVSPCIGGNCVSSHHMLGVNQKA